MRSISDYVDMGLDVATADHGAGGVLAVLGAVVVGGAAVAAVFIPENVPRCALDHSCSEESMDLLREVGIDPARDAHITAQQFRWGEGGREHGWLLHISAMHMPGLRGKSKYEIATALLDAYGLAPSLAAKSTVRKSGNMKWHPNTYMCEVTVPAPVNLEPWEIREGMRWAPHPTRPELVRGV